MKKKISIILVLVAAVATLHAQIPTIDAASLQQLSSSVPNDAAAAGNGQKHFKHIHLNS